MIVYIIVAAVLLINLINPRILWYIDAWKYKGTEKGEPSPGYLFGCRILSALGLIIFALVLYFRPIHLEDPGSADAEIRITKQHIYVENGEPFIDFENYDDFQTPFHPFPYFPVKSFSGWSMTYVFLSPVIWSMTPLKMI